MKMKMRRWFLAAAAILFAIAMAGCPVGTDPIPTPTPTPPPPLPTPDLAWTTPFELATDARIQALALGLTDHEAIFGFDADPDPDAEPVMPLSPVAPEGSPMLTITTMAGPGDQAVSIRVATGVLIPAVGDDFENLPGTNPDDGPEPGGLWREFTGYNPSWGPGLGLSAELVPFRVGDRIRFVGELLDMGSQGGWPTDNPQAPDWGAPIVPPEFGWQGRWWPADGTPRLVLTVGVGDTHGEHDRLLPNRVVWYRNTAGSFDHEITLTPADIAAIARANADLADEEDVASIRLGLAGINMEMRIDNIVFTPHAGPPTPTPPPASVNVTPSTADVVQGQTQQFSATVLPAGAPQAVTWSVDPEAAGTITQGAAGGLLTLAATATGTVTVRATATGTTTYGTATVTVIPPAGIPDAYTGLEISIVAEDGSSRIIEAIIAANSRGYAGIDADGNLIASSQAWDGEDVYVYIEFEEPLLLSDFYTFEMTWDISPAPMPNPWTGVYFGIALVSDFDNEDAVIAEDSIWLPGPYATFEGNFDLRGNTEPIVGIRINRGDDIFDMVTISDMAFTWREAPLDVTITIDGEEVPALLVVGSIEGDYILPVDGALDIWVYPPVYIGDMSYITLEWTPGSTNWHFQMSLAFGDDTIDLVNPAGAGEMANSITLDINEMVADWSAGVDPDWYLTGISFSGINFDPAEIAITSISIYRGDNGDNDDPTPTPTPPPLGGLIIGDEPVAFDLVTGTFDNGYMVTDRQFDENVPAYVEVLGIELDEPVYIGDLSYVTVNLRPYAGWDGGSFAIRLTFDDDKIVVVATDWVAGSPFNSFTLGLGERPGWATSPEVEDTSGYLVSFTLTVGGEAMGRDIASIVFSE